MSISLLNIPTYWITCDKARDRWPRMEALFKHLNMSNTSKINGRITTPNTIGVAETHIEALKRGKELNSPFLILEDDVQLNPILPHIPEVIALPECDAFYLGTATYGRVRKRTYVEGTLVCDLGDYYKPLNMLCIHAVVYNTHTYIDHVISCLENFIELLPSLPNSPGPPGCDNPIAESMWKFDIKCLKVPLFYQQDGHTDTHTTWPLSPIL